jgi:hypothetical protein
LPSDAGWFMKIGVGVVSMIVLLNIFKQGTKFVAIRMVKRMQRQNA